MFSKTMIYQIKIVTLTLSKFHIWKQMKKQDILMWNYWSLKL